MQKYIHFWPHTQGPNGKMSKAIKSIGIELWWLAIDCASLPLISYFAQYRYLRCILQCNYQILKMVLFDRVEKYWRYKRYKSFGGLALNIGLDKHPQKMSIKLWFFSYLFLLGYVMGWFSIESSHRDVFLVASTYVFPPHLWRSVKKSKDQYDQYFSGFRLKTYCCCCGYSLELPSWCNFNDVAFPIFHHHPHIEWSKFENYNILEMISLNALTDSLDLISNGLSKLQWKQIKHIRRRFCQFSRFTALYR